MGWAYTKPQKIRLISLVHTRDEVTIHEPFFAYYGYDKDGYRWYATEVPTCKDNFTVFRGKHQVPWYLIIHEDDSEKEIETQIEYCHKVIRVTKEYHRAKNEFEAL